jgi:putative ABC transport system permease protein
MKTMRRREGFVPELGEAVGQGVAALRGHPLRTALGMLAILVAVATIAVVVSALDGVRRFAEVNAARAFGSDTFVLAQVAPGASISRKDLELKLQRNPAIKRRDVRFLEIYAADRVIYAPSAQRNGEVSAGNRRYDYAAITGTGVEMADIRDLGIEAGRFFRADEETRAAQVAVIGADVADALFPAQDPLGARIRIAGRGFEVIGVQGRLGTSGGASQDRYVWVPLQAFERLFGEPASLQIFARATPKVSTPDAENHAAASMRARRQLAPGAPDTFDLLSPEAARDFVFRLTQRIGAAALPISVMALLAAIVVITNTTLVSVSQRTREIGVRRAIGASRRQITHEVVAESLLVAIGGGLLGIVAAYGVVTTIAQVAGFPMTLAWSTVGWGVLASTSSGVVAGWYPARRATRIDVIAAIRSE